MLRMLLAAAVNIVVDVCLAMTVAMAVALPLKILVVHVFVDARGDGDNIPRMDEARQIAEQTEQDIDERVC